MNDLTNLIMNELAGEKSVDESSLAGAVVPGHYHIDTIHHHDVLLSQMWIYTGHKYGCMLVSVYP